MLPRTMVRTLIAGCGYVGNVLAASLARDGHEVWGLRRDADRLPEGVRPLVADLTDAASLEAIPRELDFVVHAAAPGRGGSHRAIYLEGLQRILDVLESRGEQPRRVVFVSSTSVYGQRKGEWVDEGSDTLPLRENGEILLAAERCLLEAMGAGTVVRLGGIYGPGRTRMIDQVREGRAALRRSPHYTNRIHRDDAAGLLRHLLSLEEPERMYLGVDCAPSDEAEILLWLAEQLGVDPPDRTEAEEGGRPRGRSGSKRCSNARVVAAGYRFQYPSYREGYGALMRERRGGS